MTDSGQPSGSTGPAIADTGDDPARLSKSPSTGSQLGNDETASNGGSSTASGYVPPLLPYDVRRPPFELIMRLQQERSSILAEVSHESQERDWFRQQVDAIEKKAREERKRHPPPAAQPQSPKSLFPPTRSVLAQLESEADRVNQTLRTRFGSEAEIDERKQARLRRIHDLDLAMLRLQQASSEDLSQTGPHRESAEGSETVNNDEKATSSTTTQHHDTPSTTPDNDKKPTRALVTTATQTSPADLALELTLPDILLRESSVFSHSPPSPHAAGDMCSSEVCEPNVSSAGQTCKLEVVYSLLSMLGTHDTEDLSRTLLAMTSSPDSCHAMRQSGCLPLLVQLLHGSCDPAAPGAPTPSGGPRGRGSRAARRRAAQALRNLVASNPDERAGRRELRVLKLLEQLREYCDGEEDEDEEGSLSSSSLGAEASPTPAPTSEQKPGAAVAALMKLSFNSEHHAAMCSLGGVQAIAELLRVEDNREMESTGSVTTRRYACMALTNLTFGDGANKALLCALRLPMEALVGQLSADKSEELQQVAASVLRNLSWRADLNSKRALREVAAPARLMRAAMHCAKETTLKSVLSALWNLSAHCTENKADICAVDGALRFLVSTLTYKSPSKSLAVVENGGGILRNTSSVIALREEYRECLRASNCLPTLLRLLRSPSLTVVSNACGTLWNLSASCPTDQTRLWELGAVPMLRNLVHSKHKMISMGSQSALKNLLAARPNLPLTDTKKTEMDASTPSSTSTSRAASTASAPTHCLLNIQHNQPGVPRSCSKDSVHSDQTHDRLRHVDLGLSPNYSGVLPFALVGSETMAMSAHFPSHGRSELALGGGEAAEAVAGEWQSVTRGIEELQLSANFVPPLSPPAVPPVPPPQHRLSTATNEDQEPLTFCTEGTPYGVSTAASVSDLLQVEPPTTEPPCVAMPPPPPPRGPLLPASCVELGLVRSPGGSRSRFTRHRASVASADGNESDANSEKPQDFGSRFGEGSAPTGSVPGHLPAVSPRTYAVEDTPVTGGASRCSSLSSISELDEAAASSPAPVLPAAPSVNPATTTPAKKCPAPVVSTAGSSTDHTHVLERIEERASSEARETAAAGPHLGLKKTVTFVMAASPLLHDPQLAEETPLMFSRSSSLSSLGSSLGERSLHSSVVSEYSRSRNSEVVSPSDLPDSPTAPRKAEKEEKKEETEELKAGTKESSNSSLDDEPLLSAVIQSALPPPGSKPQRVADSLTLYAMEDTPQGFSTMASSLSDLTVDPRPAPPRPQPAQPRNTDATTVYATEGTPAQYSYNSPLSSLLSPASTHPHSPAATRNPPAPPPRDSRHSTPHTPATAEDRSSLSSLSIDSAGLDRSLLEECISSALPTSRPAHTRSNKSGQRSAGVGAARPSRSTTMPVLPGRSRLPQPGVLVNSGAATVGRLSRKDASVTAHKTTRHPAVGQETREPAPQSTAPPHQRSRSAGAPPAASRLDKASRMSSGRAGAPLPPVPSQTATSVAAASAAIASSLATQAAPGQFWGSAPISPSIQVKSRKTRMHKSKSATEDRRRSSSNTAQPPDLPPPTMVVHPKPPGWRATSFSKKKKRPKTPTAEEEPRPAIPPPTPAQTGNFLAVGSGAGRISDENNSSRRSSSGPAPPRNSAWRWSGAGVGTNPDRRLCAMTLPIVGGGGGLIPYQELAVRRRCVREGESVCEVTYSLSTPTSENATQRGTGLTPLLWDDLNEDSLEIDAADCHKADTDDDVDSLISDEHLLSATPSPPPPPRARIVKPSSAPPPPPPPPPAPIRGGRRPRRPPPPSTPVRLTKAAAQRISLNQHGRTFSAPATTGRETKTRPRELNNNIPATKSVRGRGGAGVVTRRSSEQPRSRVDRQTRVIEPSDVLTAAPVFCTAETTKTCAGGDQQAQSSEVWIHRGDVAPNSVRKKPSSRVTPICRNTDNTEVTPKKVVRPLHRVLPSL